MIKILHQKTGRYAPVLLCDACGKPITHAGLAAAITLSDPIPEGEHSDVLYVHKGECHSLTDVRLGKQSGWEEMSRHLLHLLYNIGLSPEKLLALRYMDTGIGLFPPSEGYDPRNDSQST